MKHIFLMAFLLNAFQGIGQTRVNVLNDQYHLGINFNAVKMISEKIGIAVGDKGTIVRFDISDGKPMQKEIQALKKSIKKTNW